ncbi:iron(III) transport system ATP-binding protein [Mesocricetibacter intestinalis]|uniref:Iron(III) transport system ATP-binding protein n=1 Tax=Mesocricetibacter intestinalis TaxID=1521930 RepID=A0A4V3D9F9_9PAST|nr:ABC transporter ATP-binding protein [Mesocricetibacter intestinalis]TDQ56407.1 iron(III) transport system ATP-binding protein [Mesocricetibacter intestinalis]
MKTLQIKSLNCGYRKQPIIQNLDLQLNENEILCLLGSSGCGKTTLLKAIAGLQPIQSGQILLAGEDISNRPAEQRRTGFIFQDYALFPHLNAAQNILFGLSEKDKGEQQEILEKITALVQLEGLLQRYPHELSGGQQQRVAIARSLACQPKLLLLDEPFSNIDTQVRRQMLEKIRQILKQQKMSAVFVTHSKEEAFVFADRLAIMAQGNILQTGSAENLYHRPNSKFVAEFLGVVNYLPCRLTSPQSLSSPLGEYHFNRALQLADGRPAMQNQNLEWLIRPQHLVLHPDIQSATRIKAKYFAGAYYQYELQTGEYYISVQSVQPLPVGTAVRVEYQHREALLFASTE